MLNINSRVVREFVLGIIFNPFYRYEYIGATRVDDSRRRESLALSNYFHEFIVINIPLYAPYNNVMQMSIFDIVLCFMYTYITTHSRFIVSFYTLFRFRLPVFRQVPYIYRHAPGSCSTNSPEQPAETPRFIIIFCLFVFFIFQQVTTISSFGCAFSLPVHINFMEYQ